MKAAKASAAIRAARISKHHQPSLQAIILIGEGLERFGSALVNDLICDLSTKIVRLS